MKEKVKNKNTIKKILFPILIIALIVFILIIRKDYSFLTLFQDMEQLKEYILSFGSLAPFIFGIIQFLQVIISPIPGNLTTLAGGALFGFWPSLAISSVSIVLASLAAFGLARIFGRPFVEWILGKEKVDKYFNTITNNTKIIFVLIILLPFFPDDIICFIAGISGMSWGFFILTMLIARPPGLIVSALVGARGLSLPIWAWIAIFLFAVIVIFAYIKVKKHLDAKND